MFLSKNKYLRFRVSKVINSEQIVLKFKLKMYTSLKCVSISDKMQSNMCDYFVNKGCSMGLFIGLNPVSKSL